MTLLTVNHDEDLVEGGVELILEGLRDANLSHLQLSEVLLELLLEVFRFNELSLLPLEDLHYLQQKLYRPLLI